MTLIYSTAYADRRGYLAGAVTLLDDWLKRDRFIFGKKDPTVYDSMVRVTHVHHS